MADDTVKSHPLSFHEPIFGLAWVLLLICMFLPQGGFGFGRYVAGSVIVVNGLELAFTAITLGPPLILLALLPALFNPAILFSSPMPLVFSVILSDVLFLISPLLLWWSGSAPEKLRRSWLVYASLNLICVVLLMLTLLSMPMVSHIDPNNGANQVLPGFLLWIAAQVTLTVAAALKV